jgi:RimJ/RimL family protein N-acetyltransferase
MNDWQGKLIRLRSVEPSDWQIHHEWNKDTEAARTSYFIPFPTSTERDKQWAEKEALNSQATDEYRFQIEALANGELVGTINTHTCNPRDGTFSYGLAVLPQHQRKGYASEAVIIVMRHFFGERRYQKVFATVFSFNEPSMRLHESLGFQLEGRIRRMKYTRGQYFDELVYGMTLEEFFAKYGEYGE